jgi:hypothetical protein
MPSVNLGAPLAPIYLENPPQTMPEEGTEDYELLLLETGGASASWTPGQSIAGHIAATRRPEDYPDWLDPVKDRDARWGYSEGSEPTPDPDPDPTPTPTPDPTPTPTPDPTPERQPVKTYDEKDPRGAPIAPIYLLNPPEIMPEKGTEDYELLLLETGGASASWEPGRSLAGHIAATRKPEDYPIWLDPKRDIDIRWVEDPENWVRPPVEIPPIPPNTTPIIDPDPDPNGNEIQPIYLENPPATKPIRGTEEYDLLLIETDGASAESGWNYKGHIAATRRPEDYPDWLDPVKDRDDRWGWAYISPSEPSPEPITFEEKAPNGSPIADIYLLNPPATMPEKGSTEYALLLLETGLDSMNSESYTGHIAATRPPSLYPDWLDPERDINIRWVEDPENWVRPPVVIPEIPEDAKVIIDEEPDANGNQIQPIYLENPPETKPIRGTKEYDLLLIETDGASAELNWNYKGHIAATRRPKDYPNWLDPVVDIDDRWVDPTKLNTSKTFEKELEEYEFFRRSDGSIEIKTEEGFDEITGIPKLQFANKAVSAIAEIEATFDQVKAKDDVTGKMFRVYNAAFNRFPDSDGLEYWIEKNGSGENTERQVAESFLASNEFKEKYGEDLSNEQYVKTLYQNILARDPDVDGYNYWVGQLNNGIEKRSELLLGFAESTENQTLFSEVTGLY